MALELEEEKKVQSEWEKRVQEQAKKIENLSSMVLYSKRDENHDEIKIKKVHKNKNVLHLLQFCNYNFQIYANWEAFL